MMNMKKRFGRSLYAIRDSLGMTQKMFADSLKDTVNRIKKLENGYTKPDFEFLGNLRWVHNVSLDRLFDNLKKK
jgi:transcriptional regulator with XRE-family HTH domain